MNKLYKVWDDVACATDWHVGSYMRQLFISPRSPIYYWEGTSFLPITIASCACLFNSWSLLAFLMGFYFLFFWGGGSDIVVGNEESCWPGSLSIGVLLWQSNLNVSVILLRFCCFWWMILAVVACRVTGLVVFNMKEWMCWGLTRWGEYWEFTLSWWKTKTWPLSLEKLYGSTIGQCLMWLFGRENDVHIFVSV